MPERSPIPYAPNLKQLRELLEASQRHPTLAAAATTIGLTDRFKDYDAEAAEALGLAMRHEGGLVLAAPGHALLRTAPGSAEEAAIFLRAIRSAPAIQALFPDLFGPSGPTRAQIVERLVTEAGMKPTMAEQRGAALDRWRRHVLAPRQQLLPFATASDETR